MAVELCPDNSSRGMSPRISFSQDFNQTEGVPIEPQSFFPLPNSSDFDFCTRKSYDYDQESSSADELFSNGVILPAQIKKKPLPTKNITDISKSLPPPAPPLPPSQDCIELKEEADDKQQQQQQNSKSFWGFKRSRSLNCGSIYGKGLCPLPLLSRSKSTGSTSSAKKSLFSKDDRQNNSSTSSTNGSKQHAQKNLSSAMKFSQNSSSSVMTHQKPPLKKNYGQFSSNGVTVTPVLNVPSANLFGLGSIFSSTKERSKKK
ncbi:hypothetical protein Ancab_034766 [Ancistrocladus abbreviatus]